MNKRKPHYRLRVRINRVTGFKHWSVEHNGNRTLWFATASRAIREVQRVVGAGQARSIFVLPRTN
jgi:hypothetical protein